MVSINSINRVNNQHQQAYQVPAIKPETQKELQALGISTQNIKTESQAQEVIKQFKELQAIQNQMQAQGTQNVQDLKSTEQVTKAEGSEQTRAYAGGQAASVQGQPQAFQMMNDIIAQQNKLKLGLI